MSKSYLGRVVGKDLFCGRARAVPGVGFALGGVALVHGLDEG